MQLQQSLLIFLKNFHFLLILDVTKTLGVGCLVNYNFFHEYHLFMLLPLMVCFGTMIVWMVALVCKTPKARYTLESMTSRLYKYGWLLVFGLYMNLMIGTIYAGGWKLVWGLLI